MLRDLIILNFILINSRLVFRHCGSVKSERTRMLTTFYELMLNANGCLKNAAKKFFVICTNINVLK